MKDGIIDGVIILKMTLNKIGYDSENWLVGLRLEPVLAPYKHGKAISGPIKMCQGSYPADRLLDSAQELSFLQLVNI